MYHVAMLEILDSYYLTTAQISTDQLEPSNLFVTKKSLFMVMDAPYATNQNSF